MSVQPRKSAFAVNKGHTAAVSYTHLDVYKRQAEKLALGIMIQIREGTSAKNLETLLPLVNDDNWPNFCFCADDIHAGDILDGGDVLGLSLIHI